MRSSGDVVGSMYVWDKNLQRTFPNDIFLRHIRSIQQKLRDSPRRWSRDWERGPGTGAERADFFFF